MISYCIRDAPMVHKIYLILPIIVCPSSDCYPAPLLVPSQTLLLLVFIRTPTGLYCTFITFISHSIGLLLHLYCICIAFYCICIAFYCILLHLYHTPIAFIGLLVFHFFPFHSYHICLASLGLPSHSISFYHILSHSLLGLRWICINS